MTIETLQRLTQGSSRGQFLGRAGAASLALLAGRMISADDAQAFQHGCALCDPNTPACPGNVVCYWCWWGDCHINPGGTVQHRTQCCEGYKSGGSCGGDCGTNWACSAYGGQSSC